MMMVVLPKGEGRGAAAAAASASSFFGMSVFGPCIRSPSPSNHPLCYMVAPYSRACSLTLTQDAVTSSAPLTMSRARLHRCDSAPHAHCQTEDAGVYLVAATTFLRGLLRSLHPERAASHGS
jgi:hypothetical protein